MPFSLRERQVATINGIRIGWTREHYEGFWKRAEKGEWEPQTYREIDRHVTAGTIFIDAGANIGAISLYAAQRASHVYCFEPDPVSHDMLLANIAANPELAARMTVIPKALHPSGRPIRFGSQNRGGDSMSSAVLPDLKTVWTVESMTPAEVNALLPPDGHPVFVKMDIEGGEYGLIPEAGALWGRSNLVLLLSTHQDVMRRFMQQREIRYRTWRLFAALRGYEVRRIASHANERIAALSLLHRCGLAAPLGASDWLFTPRRGR